MSMANKQHYDAVSHQDDSEQTSRDQQGFLTDQPPSTTRPSSTENTLNEISQVSFVLNGKLHKDVIISQPTQTLLEYLHSPEVQLSGTKYGCGQGGCGACSLLIKSGDQPYRSINSCLRPLAACDGLTIMSVEGLPKNNPCSLPLPTSSVLADNQGSGDTNAAPHTVNVAAYTIAENAGSQCGYCTPGFTMMLHEAQLNQQQQYSQQSHAQCPRKEEDILHDIEDLYAGNICRCTGYRGLRLAAKKLLLPSDNKGLQRELIETPSYVMDVNQQSYIHNTLNSNRVWLRSIDTGGEQTPRHVENSQGSNFLNVDPPSSPSDPISVFEPRATNKAKISKVRKIVSPTIGSNQASAVGSATSDPHSIQSIEAARTTREQRWFRASTFTDAETILLGAVNKGLKYKLVYGNTSVGIYKTLEWEDIDCFVDMNYISNQTNEPRVLSLSSGGDQELLIPAACTINSLKHFIVNSADAYCETDAILSLLRRVAGNQVRNVGTVCGGVVLAVRRHFISDTFLALATAGATAKVSCINEEKTDFKSAQALPLTSYLPQHRASHSSLMDMEDSCFLLHELRVPLTAKTKGASLTVEPYIRCYKVARRLQNSHSLINLGCRCDFDDSGQRWRASIIVGNIAPRFTFLEETSTAIDGLIAELNGDKGSCCQGLFDLFSSCLHQHATKEVLGKIERIIEIATKELNTKVQPTQEFDSADDRVLLATNLARRFLFTFLGELTGYQLTDEYSATYDTFTEKMAADARGGQMFGVNKEDFPVTEPMIKTTAVQQAVGTTEYTRNTTLPEQVVHATFVLSSYATGKLDWNKDKVSKLPVTLSKLIEDKFGLKVGSNEIHFFRACDIGPDHNILGRASWKTYQQYLLADLEVVYCGQPIAIIVTPEQWLTEYVAGVLGSEQAQMRTPAAFTSSAASASSSPLPSQNSTSSDLGIVSYLFTYPPILTLDNLSDKVPVLERDANGNTTQVLRDRKFNTKELNNTTAQYNAINWISSMSQSDWSAGTDGDTAPKINFDQFHGDDSKYVVVQGTHEVGSQYHFYLETQCALAEAPVNVVPLDVSEKAGSASNDSGSIHCLGPAAFLHLNRIKEHNVELERVRSHPVSRMVSVSQLGKATITRAASESRDSDSDKQDKPLTVRKSMRITASTQSNNSVSQSCSTLLAGINKFDENTIYDVKTEVPSVGGGFGGKEPQSILAPLAAAFVADRLDLACRVALDRDTDMRMIGKRHAMLGEYTVAIHRETGKIKALHIRYIGDAGCNYDCSLPVMDLAVLTGFNAYNIDQVVVEGAVYFTNKATSTAFRSFGVVQAHQITEVAVEHALRAVKSTRSVFQLRCENFFPWVPANAPDTPIQKCPATPYGQALPACNIDGVWASLSRRMIQKKFRASNDPDQLAVDAVREDPSAGYKYMEEQIKEFNEKHEYVKRGFAALPLMYGISFTYIPMNVMVAAMNICKSSQIVTVKCFGIEMGQGLQTKLLQIASSALGVKPQYIRICTRLTDEQTVHMHLPGTGASTGTDLNGRAVQELANTQHNFLRFIKQYNVDLFNWYEENNKKWYNNGEDRWPEVVAWWAANVHRLKEENIWKKYEGEGWTKEEVAVLKKYGSAQWTPKEYDILSFQVKYSMVDLLVSINESIKRGAPFYYFNYAAAMAHVQVDCLTGEVSTLAVDVVYDAGVSINPSIDIGQMEGGLVQGIGFVSTEEIQYVNSEQSSTEAGKLLTTNTWTYKPPSTTEIPQQMDMYLYPSDRYDLQLLRNEDNPNEDRCSADEVHKRHKSVELLDNFGIHSSKTTGEPPLVLGNTVWFALQDAVRHFRSETMKCPPEEGSVLQCPATTYALLRSLHRKSEEVKVEVGVEDG